MILLHTPSFLALKSCKMTFVVWFTSCKFKDIPRPIPGLSHIWSYQSVWCCYISHAFSHLITSDSFNVTWLKFSSLGCGRFLTSFISSFPRSTAPISPGNSDSLSLLQERDPKMNSTVERLVQRKFNVTPTFPKQQRNMNITTCLLVFGRELNSEGKLVWEKVLLGA